MPPPMPHPYCTRRERRTPAKGSGVFATSSAMSPVQAAHTGHAAIVAVLVKPQANRLRATAGRRCCCVDDLPIMPAPETLVPSWSCWGWRAPETLPALPRLPAVVCRRFSGGWLWPPCPPPLLRGATCWLPYCATPPGRGSGVPCVRRGHGGRAFPFRHPVAGWRAWGRERVVSREGGVLRLRPPLRVCGRLGSFLPALFFSC